MHLVGFIIRIYHDARSPERQIPLFIRGTVVNKLIKPNLCDYHRIVVLVRIGLAAVHFGDKSRANRHSSCTVRGFKRTNNPGLDAFSTLHEGHMETCVYVTYDTHCTKDN